MGLCLRFGEFELDEAQFELRRAGKAVELQPKVLDLILYLAKHRERVVPKEELFDTVWRGVVVTDASLTQALSLARRALDDTPETQHTLRTVRGKGVRFVAELSASGAPAVEASASRRVARPSTWSDTAARSSTAAETQDDPAAVAGPGDADETFLFVVLSCDAPLSGGSRHSLAGVNEVVFTRGSRRAAERSRAGELVLSLPGNALSRRHARLTRARDGWLLVDEASKNGTFLDGERISQAALELGAWVECGRTFLCLGTGRMPANGARDLDSEQAPTGCVPSITPSGESLSRRLQGLAASDLPMLLRGEAGVGKSHTARVVHQNSGRAGRLVSIDALLASASSDLLAALEAARGGTLLIENLERLSDVAASSLMIAAAEEPQRARLLATTTLDAEAFARGVSRPLATRFALQCELPALRDRRVDLGALLAAVLRERAATVQLDPKVARAFLRHAWPGNLTELAQGVSAALAVARAPTIRLGDVPFCLA